MNFLKGILKWIILAIIVIIIAVLIINLLNRPESNNKSTTNNNEYEPSVNFVDSNKDDDFEENLEDDFTEDNLIVDSPDTGNSGFLQALIGLSILTYGASYIYKNQKVKGNS